jgi:thiosulfate dehydrogenase [quinone] large subunit
MIYSFFESLKFVGHLLPVAFLRIYMGYYYLHLAIEHYKGEFLIRPILAAQIAENIPGSAAPALYKEMMTKFVPHHWEKVALLMVGIEFAIGLSYVIGYVVRPTALLGVLFAINMVYLSGVNLEEMNKTILVLHLVFAWIGAGRCLGVDYYFYKRHRGFWW